MTGQEIYDMIIKMNREAKEQNGRLVDLALPEEMYQELRAWSLAKGLLHHTADINEFHIDGVRIHTGEND